MKVESGDFVLLMDGRTGGLYWYEDDAMKRATGLSSAYVPGFDRRHQIEIFEISRVMPKMLAGKFYNAATGGFGSSCPRIERTGVIAVSDSLREAIELRRRLLGIGERADAAVEDQTRDFVREVRNRVRAEAREKIRALLPDLFEGAA